MNTENKKILKSFGRLKNLAMFVMQYIHKGGVTRLLLVAGIFISAQIYGSVPPRVSVIDALPLWCIAEGQAGPLFVYQPTNIKFCKMQYTENTSLPDKVRQTPTQEKTVVLLQYHELLSKAPVLSSNQKYSL